MTTQTLPSPPTRDAETDTELRDTGEDAETQADLGSELAYWLWVRNLGEAPIELKRWLKLIIPNDQRGCKQPCPDSKKHVCDVLKADGKPCESAQHSRKTCPHMKKG